MRSQHTPGQPRADEGARSPQDERDEPLCRAADALVRFVVHVQLPGDEEEVVAHAVDADRGEDERHLQRRGVNAARQREVTQDPREDADDDRRLVAQRLQEHRQQKQEDDVGDLRQRHLGGDLLPPQLGEVDAHHHEVEVERDADQEHAGDEDRERWPLHQRERIESQDLADRDVGAGLLRRGVRQHEREEAEGDRRRARQVELQRQLLGRERGEHHAGREPADGGEHLHAREVPRWVSQMVHRQRVAQREGRHEDGAIEDQRRVERREGRHLRQGKEHQPAQQAEHGQQSLGGEVPVGDQADEERRDHRAYRERAVREADLPAIEAKRVGQVGAHARVPAPPDEVLEEHEPRQRHFQPGLIHLHPHLAFRDARA